MSSPQPDLSPAGLPPAFPDRAAWGTAGALRAWQQAALEQYFADEPRDFLAVATPGAGKTSFALTVASNLLARRRVDRVVVVAPTEHLKVQWAAAAARINLNIDPEYGVRQGKASRDFVGIALTYAAVAANPLALRIRVEGFKTLVILDEVHHAGDALSWGEAVREAFEPATRRLMLTGTPFRSDTNPIPFVRYEADSGGGLRSRADYAYGYATALADGIVRPVLFMAYSGDLHWRTSAGDEVSARLGGPMTKDLAGQALRTALDPHGSWIPAVLQAADTRLTEVRSHVPDAGGLVIATDQTAARAYAELLHAITGTKPVVVLSDEPGSSKRIQAFADGDERWMVAVRMVSEGVDVPRLSVGVYATSISTPLFFAQAVGRFVRARKRGETASVFVPSVPHLLLHAAEMERERDHVLRAPAGADDDGLEDTLLAEAERELSEDDRPEGGGFAALASEADFDRVVFDGGEFGLAAASGSAEEQDYLGLPGLLEPDQVKDLLRRHQDTQSRSTPRAERPSVDATAGERLKELRRELNGLVAAWHHRTSSPHGVIHADLRSACGGPPTAVASADDLERRISTIRSWAVHRRS
ncbi:Superfamily II DNA or RNA helicase [Microlunatus sagamiharensis]|uniref:Superfamily II DNA or RNA helicase n=1 Tax=Microlunatus sagamiharensis TaxID=546874 RepID=A0A1H2LN76_9ACTN|nr:DEAD/DEAH box helicase [Microlunatus sagamiharensis]SDU82098.1 Superfamily II DNA or RNA helicase [Microlunatus sagamiharensis]